MNWGGGFQAEERTVCSPLKPKSKEWGVTQDTKYKLN